ncbi:MAG: response regulator transcription factor [Bdellovibrionaceae bacterium]|nr:response regulator transcription factor [Pseudobdellovibrionaceae bacterium]
MKRSTVLIVDDESYIREFLAQILSEHFQIAFAKNGKEAVETAKSIQPDIIVLDVLMPGQNGIDTCKVLREQKESSSTPIIMLTAVNEPEQRIKAFNAGADDYLAKPFLPEELIARISRKLEKTPLRQSTIKDLDFRIGNLKLQLDDLSFEVDGVRCELGQVEYKILNFLLKKRGELVSRSELNNYVWGKDLPSDRALDPHITSLRKKLQGSQGELKTVYGKGYSIILKDMEF